MKKCLKKIKTYKHNDFNINNNDDFQIKDNNAIINKKINNDTIIKDCYKYYMDEIIDLLKKKNKLFKLNNFILDKFIKIEFFNTNNYVITLKKFIEDFNNNIANSKAIVSCL